MPDNLVPLRPSSAGAVAFVHPASGLITAFQRLVPHLPGKLGVFALENCEPGGAQSQDIPSIAADYWQQLSVASSGPLLLAGWSFGGPVALTMATLAEAEGRQVTAVLLIDSGPPDLLRSRDDSLLVELAGLFEVDPAALPADTVPASEHEALTLIAEVLRTTKGLPDIAAADLQPFVDTYRWHVHAMRQPWSFTGCSAPVVLIRARDEHGWGEVPEDLGWSETLGQPPLVSWAPGTHYSMMSHDLAPRLADQLAPHLAGLDEATASALGATT